MNVKMAQESKKTKRPSMTDVARLAGVSQTAVSFILNDIPGSGISQETRDRVWAAVRELDYRPNVSARNLRTQSTNLIGYGFDNPDVVASHPVLDQFMYAVIRNLEQAGYHLLTFIAGHREDTEVYEALYGRGQVAGYILANTDNDDPRIAALLRNQIPFASFGRANDEWEMPWVDVDGTNGMAAVTRHLLERGHRRIGLITWPVGSKSGHHRESGYLKEMASSGIPVDPAWIVRGENSLQTGAEGLNALMALPADRRPTAVACVSDQIAVGAMNAAAAAGIAVGRDLALTGFDDSEMAQFLVPSLTSVRQPIPAVAHHVVDLLLRQFRGESGVNQGVLLQPELIIRQSS